MFQLISFLALCVSLAVATTGNVTSADSIVWLCQRTLGPACCSQIDFRIVPSVKARKLSRATGNTRQMMTDSFTYYTINSTTPRLQIEGSSGVALGRALHHYMRHMISSSVTWGVNGSGYHVSTAYCSRSGNVHPNLKPLPVVAIPVTQVSHGARYYLNPCTFGYTSPFWTWVQWEQELDWMALHGISMALASEGIEFLQLVVYTRHFNLTNESLLAYFTGPAYLPWLRMGNIHSYAGPLTVDFLESRYELQLKILQRMRNLSIEPILPAFDGHVPNAFFYIYNTSANFTRSGNWNAFGAGFSENYILDPSDPMFLEVARAWMEISVKLFGEARFYSADTWNENVPPSADAAFLAASSRAVIQGIQGTVLNASWIMQGWLFASDRRFWTAQRTEAYLSGVPLGALVILDLESDIEPIFPLTQGFFGHDFIWCALHNFGGRRGIYGNVSNMVEGSHETMQQYSNAVGIGITMEATEQNLFVYETVLEAAWVSESTAGPLNLSQWVTTYTGARLSNNLPAHQAAAWLRELVLTVGGPYTAQPDIGCCIHFTDLDHFPWFYTVGNAFWGTFTNYSADAVVVATRHLHRLLLHESQVGSVSQPLLFDACDVSRQFVSNVFTDLHQALAGAIRSAAAMPPEANVSVVGTVKPLLTNLLEIISVLDDLVGANENFLFGRWQADARNAYAPHLANENDFLSVLDYNAKTIVTMYGPYGFGSDYASKPWAGLLRGYHLPRWEYFASAVLRAYSGPSPPAAFPPFLPEIFFAELELAVDGPFTHNTSQIFPDQTNGKNITSLIAASLANYSEVSSLGLFSCSLSRRRSVLLTNATVLWTAWHQTDGVRAQLCRLAWPACVGYLPSSGKMLFATGPVEEHPQGEELVTIQC
jgi:alpha-N-acetylglucosaminidase